MIRVSHFAAAALLVAAACGSPPPGGATETIVFEPAMSKRQEALLGVCGDTSSTFTVGGRVGGGSVYAFENGVWNQESLPSETGLLWWCHHSATGEVFAAGEGASIVRRSTTNEWVATGIRSLVPAGTTFFGVWASDSIVVAVGGNLDPSKPGVIAVRQASDWKIVEADELPLGTLFKVWGTSANDVWVVGDRGVTLHFNGNTWESVPSATQSPLISVVGSGSNDVFAVGGSSSGEILRWDGTRWDAFATTGSPLTGVWTAPGQPLFVSGQRGYVARFHRTAGQVMRAEPREALTDPTLDLHTLFSATVEHQLVAAGADLLGGTGDEFRGAVLARTRSYDGEVTSLPDAGAIPADASQPDGGPSLGPGEPCDQDDCQAGLLCMGLWLESNIQICTAPCSGPDQCAEYGDDACCARPGLQTAVDVCIPRKYAECSE